MQNPTRPDSPETAAPTTPSDLPTTRACQLPKNAPFGEETAALICRFISEAGFTELRAAIFAGLTCDTFQRWRRQHPDFHNRLEQARHSHLQQRAAQTAALATAATNSSSSSPS